MTKGSVYIATNAYLPDLVKIGRSRDPEGRMVELSGASGVPGRFELAHAVTVSDMCAVELAIHRRLAARRVPGSEFFRIGVRDARALLNRTAFWHGARLSASSLIRRAPVRLWGLAVAAVAVCWGLTASDRLFAGHSAAPVLLVLSALVLAASVTGGRSRPSARTPARRRATGGRAVRTRRWARTEAPALILGVALAMGVIGHRYGLI